jgi:DnaK suppressor protein
MIEPGGMDERAASKRLTEERQRTVARIGELEQERHDIIEGTVNANSDDEHDPEGSTIAFERELVGSLLTEATSYLEALRLATDRLAAGTYFTCTQCGGPIAPERLSARPATTRCIRCA